MRSWSVLSSAVAVVLSAALAGSAAGQASIPPLPLGLEILFSISPGKTTFWPPFGDGDEASDRGYVAATSAQLLRNFHPAPTFAAVEVGLDALHELRGMPTPVAAVPLTLFSINQGFFDVKLNRWVSDGDLLSDAGRIVATNAQLMANFHPMPPLEDMGLDAVFIPYYRISADAACPPEIWFSTNKGWWDERLSRAISDGDLLSSKGYVVASNAQLLRNFHRMPPVADVGLDAVYVPCWRSWYCTTALNIATQPEIWFSVKTGFFDEKLGQISDGDLLSTTGRVVRTNAEILRNFPNPTMSPVLLNYGLDAVHVRARYLIATNPPMGGTVSKVAGNQLRLTFDGHLDLPAGAAVSVVSIPSGQDVTGAFDVSVATTTSPGDTLVLVERGSALASAAQYRAEPTEAFLVDPFTLEVGKLPGDVDGSGRVDVSDLLRLARGWGLSLGDGGFDPACDFNADGSLDAADLLISAANWAR
jgi:hypothetical protein